MRITSSAFEDGQEIPRQYTREAGDRSPPLAVEDIPEDAETLALVVDDPDAPNKTWVHWLIWNIPADGSGLSEGVPTDPTVEAPDGARQGVNDFGDIGYGGPMPPRGHGTHHYRFTVHALDRLLELDPGADRDALESAMEGSIIDRARLTGTYERE